MRYYVHYLHFFRLLSSSLLPCLSQRFDRCTLQPSSGDGNVELNLYFALVGSTDIPKECEINRRKLISNIHKTWLVELE